MTWDELKEEAKKMGYDIGLDSDDYEIIIKIQDDFDITFYQDGDVYFGYSVLAEQRTPDQMFAIMKALQ